MIKKQVPMGLIVGLLEAATDAESVDALLDEVVESGRITDEQANVISAQVRSGDRTALDQLWVYSYEEEWGADSRLGPDGMSYQEFGKRMEEVLSVDGQRIARIIGQAYKYPYAVEEDNGSGLDRECPDGRRAEFVTVG